MGGRGLDSGGRAGRRRKGRATLLRGDDVEQFGVDDACVRVCFVHLFIGGGAPPAELAASSFVRLGRREGLDRPSLPLSPYVAHLERPSNSSSKRRYDESRRKRVRGSSSFDDLLRWTPRPPLYGRTGTYDAHPFHGAGFAAAEAASSSRRGLDGGGGGGGVTRV
jgi:hypothetical protein